MNTETAVLDRDPARLVRRAVHQNKAFTVEGVQERIFTFAFRDLVYPQIWEDPRVDMAALELSPSSRVVTIASGGCNVLSYLTASPARIFAVDLNRAHVALNRLKFAAIQHVPDYETFFQFFGRADNPANRVIFDELLAPALDGECLRYWTSRDGLGRRRADCFSKNIYRKGLLGRFIGAAHAAARVYGKDPRRLLEARSRREQIEFFETELAPLFDRRAIRYLLGHRAALYGLGIPPAQYTALLDGRDHMADVVRERLRKLACDFDLADNYFAWQAFGRSYPHARPGPLPPYLQAPNFPTLRANIDRVSIEQTSFTDFLARQADASLDRYVLLDAQDWMDDRALTDLWGHITRTAGPDARVIFRTAGRESILPGRVPESMLARWHYLKDRSDALLAEDRSAIYGGFHIYRLAS